MKNFLSVISTLTLVAMVACAPQSRSTPRGAKGTGGAPAAGTPATQDAQVAKTKIGGQDVSFTADKKGNVTSSNSNVVVTKATCNTDPSLEISKCPNTTIEAAIAGNIIGNDNEIVPTEVNIKRLNNMIVKAEILNDKGDVQQTNENFGLANYEVTTKTIEADVTGSVSMVLVAAGQNVSDKADDTVSADVTQLGVSESVQIIGRPASFNEQALSYNNDGKVTLTPTADGELAGSQIQYTVSANIILLAAKGDNDAQLGNKMTIRLTVEKPAAPAAQTQEAAPAAPAVQPDSATPAAPAAVESAPVAAPAVEQAPAAAPAEKAASVEKSDEPEMIGGAQVVHTFPSGIQSEPPK